MEAGRQRSLDGVRSDRDCSRQLTDRNIDIHGTSYAISMFARFVFEHFSGVYGIDGWNNLVEDNEPAALRKLRPIASRV
jgi:hypothetical protein